ncbi:Imm17 family immunity protein [Brachyspira innocens]|uniref:Imm17 family immunity protein n=1 Tax=Brachyspira innocens TaxID=13264 RepID=A0ABT8Z0I8_9SPIR|nr:Imm17 family immunity protein [Brachyspira innocens]MDO6995121.1 Imm17 family immunity protein [Brachyspira innocens]MDO7021654.1 Imm17 family immunity protein [Brachyspira innocens]
MKYDEIIKKFPYLFAILVGILFILAALFKWSFLLNNNSSNFMMNIHETFGEIGVRIMTFILGLVIIICSIIIWVIRK